MNPEILAAAYEVVRGLSEFGNVQGRDKKKVERHLEGPRAELASAHPSDRRQALRLAQQTYEAQLPVRK